jgi:acyl carrier protein
VSVDAVIRGVLAEHGHLDVDASTLGADADLYARGLTSHACVNVMLALEDEYDVEFSDEMLHKGTFESVQNLGLALASLGVDVDEGSSA